MYLHVKIRLEVLGLLISQDMCAINIPLGAYTRVATFGVVTRPAHFLAQTSKLKTHTQTGTKFALTIHM
jgi:uncharacterized membrane protein